MSEQNIISEIYFMSGFKRFESISRAAFEFNWNDIFFVSDCVPYAFGKRSLDDYQALTSVIYALRMYIVRRLFEMNSDAAECTHLDLSIFEKDVVFHAAIESYAKSIERSAVSIFDEQNFSSSVATIDKCLVDYSEKFQVIEKWDDWLERRSSVPDDFASAAQIALSLNCIEFPELDLVVATNIVSGGFKSSELDQRSASAWRRLLNALEAYGNCLLEHDEVVAMFNNDLSARTNADYSEFSRLCEIFREESAPLLKRVALLIKPKALLLHSGIPKALYESREWKLMLSNALAAKAKFYLDKSNKMRVDAESIVGERVKCCADSPIKRGVGIENNEFDDNLHEFFASFGAEDCLKDNSVRDKFKKFYSVASKKQLKAMLMFFQENAPSKGSFGYAVFHNAKNHFTDMQLEDFSGVVKIGDKLVDPESPY